MGKGDLEMSFTSCVVAGMNLRVYPLQIFKHRSNKKLIKINQSQAGKVQPRSSKFMQILKQVANKSSIGQIWLIVTKLPSFKIILTHEQEL
jgi:hypothetical protein